MGGRRVGKAFQVREPAETKAETRMMAKLCKH